MATLLNNEEEKNNQKNLIESDDTDFLENINKQVTDEDLKISQNLITSEEKNLINDEDVKETSVIPTGDALYQEVENNLNKKAEQEQYNNFLDNYGINKNEINEISEDVYKKNNIEENNNYKNFLQSYGIDENEVKTIVENEYTKSKSSMYDNPQITEQIKDYWDNVMDDFSEWAVGNEADWGEFTKRGLGTSNINLALQFHADTKTNNPLVPDAIEDFFNDGIDYNEVFKAPEDRGALEYALETVVAIFADAPTFLFGAAGGSLAGPYGSAFGAGFVNDSIKEMYIQALESDTPPDSFIDWWNLFSHHGISRGIEGGLSMMSILGGQKIAANTIGKNPYINKHISNFIGRFLGFTAVGAYLNGEMPNKEELTNNAIVIGLFGFLEAAAGMGKNSPRKYISKKNIKMLNESAKLNKISVKEKVNELIRDVPALKELYSLNKEKFTKDRQERKNQAKLVKEEIELLRAQEREISKQQKERTGKDELNLGKTAKEIQKETKISQQEAVKIIEHVRETNSVNMGDLVKTFKINKEQVKSIITLLENNKFIIKSRVPGSYNVSSFEGKNIFKEKLKIQKLLVDKQIIELKNKQQTPIVKQQLKKAQKELNILKKYIKRERNNKNIGYRMNLLKEKYFNLTGQKINPPSLKKINVKSNDSKSGDGTVKLKPPITKKTFAADFIDNKQPVKAIVEKIAVIEGKKLSNDAPLTPYELLRIQPGMIGKAFQFLETGVLKFESAGSNAFIGKSFKDIINKFTSNEQLKIFDLYLINRHAIGIYNSAQGTAKQKAEFVFEQTGKDVKAAEAYVKENRSAYEKSAKEIDIYQINLINYLYKSGYFPKDLHAQFISNIKNKQYVPLKRKLDKKEFTGETKDTTSPGASGSLQKRKGSTADILSPLDSIYGNTLSFISIAERNYAIASFFKEVQQFKKKYPIYELPYRVLPVKAKIKKIEITEKEIKDKLDIETKGMEVFRKDGHLKSEKDGGVVSFYENGKLKQYYLPDRVLFESFKDLNFARLEGFGGLNWFMNLTRIPTKTLRAGITLDPRFMIANGIRDTWTAAVYSKNKFIVGIDSLKGMRSYLKRKQPGKHKDMYEAYVRSGGNQSQLLSIDRNYFSNMSASQYLKYKQSTYNNVIDFARHPNLEFLRKLGDVFESGSRVRNFELTMNRLRKANEKLPENKRMTERQMEQRAGFEARDITIDFRKMGTQIKLINQQSAFYNANVQGWTKMYEAFKNRNTAPYFFSTGIKYITIPSLLLHAFNHDSEVYQSLSQFEKDMFWIIIVDEGTDEQMIFRLPKPFELGIVFGSIPERMMSWGLNSSDVTIQQTMTQFVDGLKATITPDLTTFKPAYEIAVNKNLTTDINIVPDRLDKLLPEDRYNYSTSTTAKVLRNYEPVKKFLDFVGVEMSPMDIDHLWKNWTGQLGQYFFDAIDVILEAAEIDAKMGLKLIKPKSNNFYKRLVDFPIIGKFMVRYPKANLRYIENFYKEYKKYEVYQNSLDFSFKKDPTNEIRQNQLLDSEKGQEHLLKSYMPMFNNIFQSLFSSINAIERIPIDEDGKYQIIESLTFIMRDTGKIWQDLHDELNNSNLSNKNKLEIIEKYKNYLTTAVQSHEIEGSEQKIGISIIEQINNVNTKIWGNNAIKIQDIALPQVNSNGFYR